jgi:hypothetical protein
MSIKLVDAASYYVEEQHQTDAWNWLQDQLSEETLNTFADKYRNKTKKNEKLITANDNVPVDTIKKEENTKKNVIAFDPWSPFGYKVTPNITYGELTLNQEARRFTKHFQCETAVKLCEFLEKVRLTFNNKPIIITSGSRPEPINREVGGAKNSEHTYDAPLKGAVDFYIEGANIYDVQAWCDQNWKYSLGYGAQKGFIHIGMRETQNKIRWNY